MRQMIARGARLLLRLPRPDGKQRRLREEAVAHGERIIKNCASHCFVEERRTVHHRGVWGRKVAYVVEYCPNCNYTVEYCSGCTLRRGYYALSQRAPACA